MPKKILFLNILDIRMDLYSFYTFTVNMQISYQVKHSTWAPCGTGCKKRTKCIIFHDFRGKKYSQ